MDFDSTVGIIVLIAALVALCGLVAWSLRTIDHITHNDLRSVRDIVKGLKNVR